MFLKYRENVIGAQIMLMYLTWGVDASKANLLKYAPDTANLSRQSNLPYKIVSNIVDLWVVIRRPYLHHTSVF